MEYFDFEDASHLLPPPLNLNDISAFSNDIDTNAFGDDLSLFNISDANLGLSHPQPQSTTAAVPMTVRLANNVEVEVIPREGDLAAQYPLFLAKTPCDLCAKLGLDCFLAKRGALITGCTCCISLYRECSFTHPPTPKGYINTFAGISENGPSEITSTRKERVMRSFEEARGRKTGARFPRDAVKVLKKWLSEHADHPYPNERQKDELEQSTGLKRSQVANWLANARRRGKVRHVSDSSSPSLGAVDIPRSQKGNRDISELNPLDRWKASPPENEPASMTAIAKAVTSTPLPVDETASYSSRRDSRTSSRQASSEDESGMSMFRAPSVSSFETRDSSNSDMTFGSSRSNRSKISLASSAERRRRRRAPINQRAAAQQNKSRTARVFQCTFCTDTFPAKYDWQRHEKSLHLALERWTCCPEGGVRTVPLTGCKLCAFCQEQDPTPEHLEKHNFTACQEKSLQERTFYRKDHLRQHLKLMHSAKFDSSMESWKSMTNEIRSRCGFCPSVFTTWQQRADHLAAHFRNGADMATWTGGWGFELWVEQLVENAIPPYLIGQERHTMAPFVARKKSPSSTEPGSDLTFGTSAPTSEPDQLTLDSNCWGRLNHLLGKYVDQKTAVGLIPSDQEIQDHARLIVFEDDDPWNCTCADNQLWLDTFKYQHGIGEITGAMQPKILNEVPVYAPYVIKGGLRTKASSSKEGRGSVGHGSTGYGSMQPQSLVPMANTMDLGMGFDVNMDIDLDSIDFSSIDLGVDNTNFGNTIELPRQQAMPVLNPASNATFDDIFGGFDMPLDSAHRVPEHVTTPDGVTHLQDYRLHFPRH